MKTLLSTALIVTTLVSVTVGQGKADLDRLEEKITRHLELNLLGWKHRRLQSYGLSSSVLTQAWSSGKSTVLVTVAIRKSPEDAKEEIQSFLQSRKDPQPLTGIGDEAFVSGLNDSHIVLRRGRYVIYVGMVVDAESDKDAQDLSKDEQEKLKSELQRIGREFARQLSSIELE